MKNVTKLLIAMIAVVSLPAAAGTLNPNNAIKGSGQIYRVIDGDTLLVTFDDRGIYKNLKSKTTSKKEQSHFNDKYGTVKFRLGNVNTAESVHTDASKNSAEGKVASNYVKSAWEKKKVNFVCWDFGHYGRAICSVSYNGLDLGVDLIRKGYSDYEYKWGKHPFTHKAYMNEMQKRR
ncbi:thermonuclease family protein [Vibrio splendidus]|nr:thermonuclease family protein [Vibrio splendidus]MCC4880493.1 thermonuclease family protein [Vibrio splendidus]